MSVTGFLFGKPSSGSPSVCPQAPVGRTKSLHASPLGAATFDRLGILLSGIDYPVVMFERDCQGAYHLWWYYDERQRHRLPAGPLPPTGLFSSVAKVNPCLALWGHRTIVR